jgi:hypothetical protein
MIKEALQHVQTKGVRLVEVHFSGGGDSGQIDDISFFKEETEGGREQVTSFETTFTTEEGKTSTVVSVIEDHVYEALDASCVDWYNNDGGYGVYVFTYQGEDGWSYDHHIYKIVSYAELTFESEGKITDEGEEEA